MNGMLPFTSVLLGIFGRKPKKNIQKRQSGRKNSIEEEKTDKIWILLFIKFFRFGTNSLIIRI